MIIAKTIRPEWLNTELRNILRWEEDGGKIVEINHSTFDQKRIQTRNKWYPPESKSPTLSSATSAAVLNPKGKKRVGLWLDRNKAVIVSMADNIEARSIITSDMEHYVLYSTVVPGDGSPEEIRDRRFWNHLDEYYDKIIAQIRDAAEIQVFGPEGAKYELQGRLEAEGLSEHIVSMEDVGILTDHQIAARVQKRFPRRSQFDIFSA